LRQILGRIVTTGDVIYAVRAEADGHYMAEATVPALSEPLRGRPIACRGQSRHSKKDAERSAALALLLKLQEGAESMQSWNTQ
jgi:hypothetical protein